MASTNESHVAIHVAEDEAGHYEKAESPTAVGGAMPDNIRSMHHKSAFASHATVLLKWENISYQVEVKNSATKKMESKTVLEPMSGFAKPGELLVIMGPRYTFAPEFHASNHISNGFMHCGEIVELERHLC